MHPAVHTPFIHIWACSHLNLQWPQAFSSSRKNMLLKRHEVNALLECVATELVARPPSPWDRLKARFPAILLSPLCTEFESYVGGMQEDERQGILQRLEEHEAEVLTLLLMPLPRDVPQPMMVDLLLRVQAILVT